MLTKIMLDGPFGKEFGHEWNLQVDSPNEALRMINANKPGVFHWIRKNLMVFSHYQVVCEYADGRTEDLDQDNYLMKRQVKSIRFVPLIIGSGGQGTLQMIVGAALIVAGAITTNPGMIAMGAGMFITGAAMAISPLPQTARKDTASYYFNGPANTTVQGMPVQLVYGRVLCGSHLISAALTVSQLL